MQKPIQITERGITLRAETKAKIEKRAAGLERYDPRMTSCHVICEAPHRSQRRGRHYSVRIEAGVPGKILNVARQHDSDISVAIRDAFDAARREIEDAVREREGRVKARAEALATGRIARLFPKDGYGFIEGEGGAEVYFHRNSVLRTRFDRMKVGDKVRYAEEMGEKGPQASAVKAAG